MEKELILAQLIEIVNKFKNPSGWTDLALIGKPLSDKGINYKGLGYLKLRNLIEDFSESIETRIDTTHAVPVYFARVIEDKSSSSTSHTDGKSNKKEANRQRTRSQEVYLRDWAWIKDYNEVISQLKKLALSERWHYKEENPSFPYPILSNYLSYTFLRLYKEKDKICTNGNYACFNTGLVDSRYEPIYALFKKNIIPDHQEWYFDSFCIPGEDRAGKTLVDHFNPLPQRAHYFDNIADMLFDTKAPEPKLDWSHIILENVSRLPIDFLVEHKPANFMLQDPSKLNTLERHEYFKALGEAIEKDEKKYRAIKNRFKDSVELALKRVQWNYKTAIPMYYPKRNKMSILLPLALTDDEIIDLALVVEKTKSGAYLGHTILPLDWAYSNARLVTRPDSDWLSAEKISIGSNETEETEE